MATRQAFSLPLRILREGLDSIVLISDTDLRRSILTLAGAGADPGGRRRFGGIRGGVQLARGTSGTEGRGCRFGRQPRSRSAGTSAGRGASLVTRIGKLIGGRSRSEGNCEAIFQIAREVVERRRSMQGALNEVRHPAILDNLSDEDFRLLDEAIVESAQDYPEYALVLARLTHAAARAKGFDRQIVDSALRLDSFLPGRRSQPRARAAPARCLHHRPAGRVCPRRARDAGAARRARARCR